MREMKVLPRVATVVAFTSVVFTVALWVGARMGNMWVQPDADSYMGMAEGKPAMLPFASRQLGPQMVRAVMSWFHVSLQTAFMGQGMIALLFLIVTTGFLLVRSGAPRWTMWALAGMMFWGFQFNALVMPDLLYAALLCCFMLLLRQRQVLLACAMMFPLTLCRESTLLTLVCFLIAGWRRLKWSEIATALVSIVAAMAVVKRLAANALPNHEHISPTLYLVAKMPWNLVQNIFGIGLWANLNKACDVPKWQMPFHLGPLTAIGTCGFFPEVLHQTYGIGMAIFGLLPVLVWALRKQIVRSGGREDLMLRFALVYGIVSFLLAPLLGASFLRLYGYSWPLFLIALPLLLGASKANFTSVWAAAAFVGLHWFLAWSMMWAFPYPLLPVGSVCWVLGWLLLRKTLRIPAGDGVGQETIPA